MPNYNIQTIYLHAGMLKTGTSSIQASLAANKDFLQQHSVYYPTELAVNHSDFILPIFLDDPKVFHVEKERNLPDEMLAEECIEKKEYLKRELLNTKCKTVVFSAEGLFVFSNQVLKKLKDFLSEIAPNASIKYILCLRNTSAYLASAYQQVMKTGYRSGWKTTPNITFSYREKLEYFETLFQAENMIIYDFDESQQHPYGLVGYFVEEVLGLKKPGVSEMQILRDNDSVSDVAANILHYINVATDSPLNILSKESLKYERYISDTCPLWSFEGGKFRLDGMLVKRIYSELSSELAWIKEHYDIDYNLENAVYSDATYRIHDTFFNTAKVAFPKLSRIVRRAFYDYVCDEEDVRFSENEKMQLTLTRAWIEKYYTTTATTGLDVLKKTLTGEIQACRTFFESLNVNGKYSYQLYYHLYLFFKEVGIYDAAKIMLENYYEKNPYYNDVWDRLDGKLLVQSYKNYCFGWISMNRQRNIERAAEIFKGAFQIQIKSNRELLEQIVLFALKHDVNTKRMIEYREEPEIEII